MTRVLTAAAVAALVAAGAGGAMPTWTAPQVISGAGADGLALGPELAVNASGRAVAVWDQETGPDCADSPASLTCIHTIEAAYRASADESWDPPRAINRPGVGARPRAAIDDDGAAALIWVHDIGRDRVVQAALRESRDGDFSPAEDLSKEVLEVRSHQIARVGGSLVAAWAQRLGDAFEVRAAVRPGALGYWGTAQLLSTQGVTGGPSLAVSPDGEMLIAWVENGAVRAATGDIRTAVWGVPVTLSNPSGEAVGDPSVAVDRNGDGVVAWEWRDRLGGQAIVQAVTRSAAGVWGSRGDVGDAGTGFDGGPQVAVDASGDAIAVWVGGAAGTPLQSAVLAHAASGWSQPLTVLGSAGASSPQLAIDPEGDAVAAWIDNATKAAKASVAPAAVGAWQPPVTLSVAGAADPRIALDSSDRAVAVWSAPVAQKTGVYGADLAGGWELTLANTGRPSIQDRPRVGHAVVCRRGTWEGTVPIRYAYAWLRNGHLLRGARGARYVVRRADRGRSLACRVTATNAARSLTATSRAVRVR